LLKDVTHGDAIGMDLVNIDVPWESGMIKAEEGAGGLAGKLSKVNIVVWSTKVQEFYG